MVDTASGFYMRNEGDKLLIGVTNESEPAGENLAVDWDWLETVLGYSLETGFRFSRTPASSAANCWAGP